MKSEQLQKWALIAEICGGLAVVVTLALLIIETRQNTQVMRAATYDSIIADITSYRMETVTDNELQEAIFITESEGRASLTPRQQQIETTNNVVIFQHYERAYIQWRLGNLDDEAWERFKGIVCSNSGNPGFEENIGVRLDRLTTASFKNYRLTQCSE